MKRIASFVFFRKTTNSSCHCCLLHHLRHCSTTRSSGPSPLNLSPLYQDISRKIQKYKRELKSHSKTSFHHRYLQHSIGNLNQVVAEMECKRLKVEGTNDSDISFIPAHATLEVLSNGTTHTGPCALIKTPFKSYLFNCPEGASRFLPSLRLKGTNMHDFFITRGKWQNIGGISGVLLGKEVTKVQTRIHGPQSIKQYLECIRPFMDADFGSVKYPVSVEELTYERELYEDPALRVYYIPLFGLNLSNDSISTSQTTDVSFLFEFKSLPKKVDILKLLELKIPKGPLVGQLKAGKTVELSDGRIIQPEQIYMDDDGGESKQCNLLVTEVESLEKLHSLAGNSHMQKFYAAENTLNYVVHFTPEGVLNSAEYAKWMDSFGDDCVHVILNGGGAALPQNEGPYVHQRMLHSLSADVFPLLYPFEFRDVVLQNVEEVESRRVEGTVLQRFPLRGKLPENDLIAFNVDVDELSDRLRISASGDQQIQEWRQFCDTVAQTPVDPYPTVVVLGTSSAVPTKYRNVSAYLLRLSDTSNVLIDCGEGTYGQLRVLYGPHDCDAILVGLNALFVTHSHQDHMNGLFQVILKRIEAFQRLGITYRPLVVVCNKNVRKPLSIFSRNFDDLERYIVIVDISMLTSQGKNATNNNERESSPRPTGHRSPPRNVNASSGGMQNLFMDIAVHFPRHLYSPDEWNLRSVEAVQVHHSRMANGFVFVDAANGRRVVFSGDTMPCKLLAERGAGADVLVHECTFEDGFEEDAFRKRHCTMKQAVGIGQQMKAKYVILTHFSARYSKVPPLPDYLLEAGNVTVAMDNMVVRYDRLPLIAKLLPVYRELYATELFELEAKKNQRDLRKNVGYSPNNNSHNYRVNNNEKAPNHHKRKVSGDGSGIASR